MASRIEGYSRFETRARAATATNPAERDGPVNANA